MRVKFYQIGGLQFSATANALDRGQRIRAGTPNAAGADTAGISAAGRTSKINGEVNTIGLRQHLFSRLIAHPGGNADRPPAWRLAFSLIKQRTGVRRAADAKTGVLKFPRVVSTVVRQLTNNGVPRWPARPCANQMRISR